MISVWPWLATLQGQMVVDPAPSTAIRMNHTHTRPAPLTPALRRARRAAFQPLTWLRTRLFASAASSPGLTLNIESVTVASFQPQVGRGYALRCAHRALQALFGQQEGLRQVLPHLSLLEQALGRKGSKALRSLPAPVLQQALEQLEDLQSSERDADLGSLRMRLVETLAMRSVITQTDTGPGAPLSYFGLDVQEASNSVFEEAQRHWTAAVPTVSRQ